MSPTAAGYPPTAVGNLPTAVGCTPTAVVGYPLSAIGWSCADLLTTGHTSFFFFGIKNPLLPAVWTSTCTRTHTHPPAVLRSCITVPNPGAAWGPFHWPSNGRLRATGGSQTRSPWPLVTVVCLRLLGMGLTVPDGICCRWWSTPRHFFFRYLDK